MAIFRRSALLLLLFVPSAFPQAPETSQDARLTGVLTDPSSAGVGSVQVTATPTDKTHGLIYKATSRTDGEYALVLPPGNYRVEFARAPFATRNFDLIFAAGETRRLDLRLELEKLSSSVIVTAQAEPAETGNVAAPVTVFDKQEIEERQAVTLSNLLLFAPGISIGRTGPEGGLTSVFLDGGNSNYTKVLLDGTPVNRSGGTFDFSNLTLDNVDKVEVIHGAESSLYGSDAVSGVIQVFTHRGTTRVPAVNLFAEGGGFSSARGGASVSGLLGMFDYSSAASYFQTEGQGPNDFDLIRALSGNFGWRFSEDNRLRLVVRNDSSSAGIPGPTLFFPADPTGSDALHLFSANLAWDFNTGSHWRHRFSGTESKTSDASVSSGFPFHDEFNRAGFQEQSTFFFRQASLSGGYQYEVENGSPGGPHVRRNNQAGYLDARWTPHPRLSLNAGARAEANDSFGTRVVPRAGASATLRYGHGFWDATRLRGLYGQGIKEPRFDQSFSPDPCFPGNPSLRPERSRTVSAGIEQALASERVKVSANYFSNRFYDVVSFALIPAPAGCHFGAGTFFNTDLARARGANVTVESRPARWLAIGGNYTYDDTRVLKSLNPFADPALMPGNHLLRRPVHSGALVLNAGFRRINGNLAGYFSGPRTDSNFVQPTQTRNPGYARFDVATRYNFGRGVSFYGRVTNLLDKQYQDALGYPALGRDFRLGINYRFGGKE